MAGWIVGTEEKKGQKHNEVRRVFKVSTSDTPDIAPALLCAPASLRYALGESFRIPHLFQKRTLTSLRPHPHPRPAFGPIPEKKNPRAPSRLTAWPLPTAGERAYDSHLIASPSREDDCKGIERPCIRLWSSTIRKTPCLTSRIRNKATVNQRLSHPVSSRTTTHRYQIASW